MLGHWRCSALRGEQLVASCWRQLILQIRYVAEAYLETDDGRAEAERAKKEGSKLYLQAKEVVLRPGVAGGLAGARTSARQPYRVFLADLQ